MAIDAAIPRATAPSEIPIPPHAAVSALAVVTVLRSVALRTELEHLGHGQLSAVGEVEGSRVADDVALAADESSVLDDEPLVELLQVRGRGRQGLALSL